MLNFLFRIRSLSKELLSREFAKNSGFMLVGTVISQAIPVLISPVLTSIYTTEEIGVFAVFTSLTAIAAAIITGKYQMAMMLPRNKDDAISIFWLCVFLASVFCSLMLVIVYVFDTQIVSIIGNEQIRHWIVYIPLSALVIASWDSLSLYVSRLKLFKVNATSRISNSITYAVLSISSGLLFKTSFQAGFLIFSRMIAFGMATVFLMQKELFSLRLPKIISLMKKNAKKYSDFPKYLLIPSVLDTISIQVPILVISKYFSLTNAGYYNLTNLVLNAPLAFIASAYGQVFFQKISSYDSLNSAYSFFKKNVLILFGINLVFSSLVLWQGSFLFEFFFGRDWSTSGYYASILAPSLLLKSVASPLSVVFSAWNKVKVASIWLYTYFCSTVLTFSISIYLDVDLVLLIKIYVVHEIVLYALYLYLQFSIFFPKRTKETHLTP